jgi:hypothetical protein
MGFRWLVLRLRSAPSVRFENGAFLGVAAHAVEKNGDAKNLLAVLCV